MLCASPPPPLSLHGQVTTGGCIGTSCDQGPWPITTDLVVLSSYIVHNSGVKYSASIYLNEMQKTLPQILWGPDGRMERELSSTYTQYHGLCDDGDFFL